MKTRMQVLAAYFEPSIEYDNNEPSKDMQLAITLNPDLKRIEGAMEEYTEQAVKLALDKAAERIRVTMNSTKGNDTYYVGAKDAMRSSITWIESITPASIINEIENTVKE